MLRVIVRSSTDASAVKAAIKRFHEGIISEVVHVGGVRGSKFWDRVDELVKNRDTFNIVLTGRRDYNTEDYLNLDALPHVAAALIPKIEVRRATLGEISKYINQARVKFRMSVGWKPEVNAYKAKVSEDKLLSKDIVNPLYDAFPLIQDGVKHLEKIINSELHSDMVLLIRKHGGIHDVYLGNKKVAIIRFSDMGCKPEVISKETIDIERHNVNLESTLSLNAEVLKTYEEISLKLLKIFEDGVDQVIIHWSGGKDSTVALLLAIKAFGKSNVMAIYSDTGVDFRENMEYIESVSRKLGINYIYVRAPVSEELKLGHSLPTHNDRWCTGLKKASIRSVINNYFRNKKILMVLGDRDAESIGRSRKGFIEYEDENVVNVYPLKLWSALLVHLYLAYNGIPLNKLYLKGFYRIGCYICPSLRSWELFILLNNNEFTRKYYRSDVGIRFLRLKGVNSLP